ncbi:glycosyltransferase [Spirosoma aerolatum]|uniref:glycosyltransferase n=1 Tax=Spirosoma aerolatum TaxID=1211326 RepID=UPI0009ACF34F|nr:glycosyltransferase [Spirosoma aerolatum]
MKILYVIPRMTYGGGMPVILTELKTMRRLGVEVSGTIIVLEKGVSTQLMTEAVSNGVKVLLAPSSALAGKLISQADVTVVHYWNCPSLFRFFRLLADMQVPHRLCLSVRVNGCTLPQVVPQWVYSNTDALVRLHSCTPTNGLRPDTETLTLPSLIRLPDLAAPPPVPDFSTFRLFHAGTLNYFKTHPQLIALHEGLAIDSYRFDIWGSGLDTLFENDLAVAQHALYRGFSTNLYADMAPYHVLCNPQTALSYGSYDKIMCESQWVGKPVIVLKDSYIAEHIHSGINGLVADDEYQYRAILEMLSAKPDLYKKLSDSTFEYTRSNYTLTDYAVALAGLYQRMIQKPLKIADAASIPGHPADAALDGLGHWKQLLANDSRALSLEAIKYALRCEGGLIHYYKDYPDDSVLRMHITQLLALENSLTS